MLIEVRYKATRKNSNEIIERESGRASQGEDVDTCKSVVVRKGKADISLPVTQSF